MVSMSFLQPIIALLQFTTILPLGKTAPFDDFARNIWIYPIAGYVTGGIAGFILFILPVPSLVSASIGLGVIFLLTGCNHLDGLFDLGDGLMAHGSREIRVRALTDRMVGTGGIALGLIITLIAMGSLASVPSLCASIILAEVGGKYAMAVMTTFGRPFHSGLHAILHEQTKPGFIALSTLLLLPLCTLPIAWLGIGCSFIAMVLVPAVLIIIASRLFGGVNGDVTGAAGEITRAVILTVIAGTAGYPVLMNVLAIPGLL